MDRNYFLDDKIFYLTTLISLVSKRLPCTKRRLERQSNFQYDGTSDSGYPEMSSVTWKEDGLEIAPPEDEAEFDVDIAAENGEVPLEILKRNALDRLAECLARFKTDPKLPKKKGKRENQDANHVSSATMMEGTGDQPGVMIFLSKNNGIDSVDEEFLANLKEKLEIISKQGSFVLSTRT